ncbi:MAG TPA: hypothetical protein VJ508_02075, partial [Saprospiraceae bacterium]|nr:hypothetical protein [Saprospiraceae bacterium]
MCLIAAPEAKPRITIQRLQGKEIPEGAISLAYFIEEPKGKGCAWARTPWVMASSLEWAGVDGVIIRINGQLHTLRMKGNGYTGPKVLDGTTYRKFIEYSDSDVQIEIYGNVVDQAETYRCTKG